MEALVSRARRAIMLIVAILAVAAPTTHAQVEDPFSPITISVKNQDIQDVLSMMSRARGLNIVSSGSVRGQISIDLTEVPFQDALRSVVAMAGYDITEKDGIFYVHDPDGQDQSGAATVESRTYRLSYGTPDDLLPIVEEILSPFGSVVGYDPLRALVVEDRPHILDRVERVLEGLDTAPRQVLIEASIYEVRLTEDLRFGINWSSLLDGDAGSIISTGFAGSPQSGVDGTFITWEDGDLSTALEALEAITDLRTLASPRIIVVDGTQAEIIIGGKLGFPVSRTFENTLIQSVEFLDTGTQLIVTPTIAGDGNVRLTVHPELSDGQVQGGLPSKTTTEVSTDVIVRDGQTLFIGGLIREREESSRRGIPLLVRIPLIGGLFGRTVTSIQRSEIVTVIRPHILDPDGDPPIEGYRLLDTSEIDLSEMNKGKP